MTGTTNDRAAPMPARMLASRSRWPDDVRVWRIEHADDATWLAQRNALTPSEQARAARFLRPADQARFIAARATLRRLLATECDVSPSVLRFEIGPYGRPSLADFPRCSFNVSHAGTYALIAISTMRTVGIDVECIDTLLDWRALARRVCTQDESAAIARLPVARQTPQFFRCWTAKEALLKALGIGIGEALQSLGVDLTVEANPHMALAEQRPILHGNTPAVANAAALRFVWIDDLASDCSSDDGGAPMTSRMDDTAPDTDPRESDADLPVVDRVGYSACVAYSADSNDIS